MNIYKITVKEALERVIEVKAISYEDALEQVEYDYRNQKFILNADDWTETLFQ